MSENQNHDTIKITFPRIPAYKQVGDFLASRLTLHHVQAPRCQWDKPRIDPDLDFILAQRAYANTVEELKSKKVYYQEKKKFLQQQWDELEELEKSLQANFVKMSKFISSNAEKRKRATERTHEDSELVKRREKEIELLQNKVSVLTGIKQEIDKQIAALSIYEKYLHQVLGISTEFINFFDIIDRYESLVATKIDLGQKQNDTFFQLEQAKNTLTKISDDNAFRLLGMNNILSTMQSRYQIALNHSMHWERIVYNIKNIALQKFKEITEVKQSCRNIYHIMCKRKGEIPKIQDDNFEKQLLYIKKTLKQLSTITKEAAVVTKKTFSSMKGETSKVS